MGRVELSSSLQKLLFWGHDKTAYCLIMVLSKGSHDKEVKIFLISVDDLEKENIDLKEQRLCKICMVDNSSIVFLPCGHLVACAACSPALNICPICREPIKGIVRTFIA